MRQTYKNSKPFLAVVAVLLAATAVRAQSPQVRLKIRVVIVDKDLNQKPVPFLVVKFANSAGGTDTEVKTGLDGSAQIPRASCH